MQSPILVISSFGINTDALFDLVIEKFPSVSIKATLKDLLFSYVLPMMIQIVL
jgi:hypothetical protein